MTDSKTYQEYATTLRADIDAAATAGLPRREVLISWLDDFLLRAKKRGFEMVKEDSDNLTALDQFVRFNRIPATARVPLE